VVASALACGCGWSACGLLRVVWLVVCSVGYNLGKHMCKIKSGA